MCGIFGLVLPHGGLAFDFLRGGLLRLEYRGYDSCGVAVLNSLSEVVCYKSEGMVHHLLSSIQDVPSGSIGIAHTRWATHGPPTVMNAHPVSSNGVYVVHNGIIENYVELKSELEKAGFVFITDTDTEVIAHYIAQMIDNGHSPLEASRLCIAALKGRFAVLCMFVGQDFLIGFKKSAPLVVGFGDNIVSITSDVQAASPFLRRFTHLKDGDIAVVSSSCTKIYNEGNLVERPLKDFCLDCMEHFGVDYNNKYGHFMLREILEQPTAIANTISRFSVESLLSLDVDLSELQHITIVGCGSSYFAAAVAKCWFEIFAKIVVSLEIASEFRYLKRNTRNDLVIFVSQSGETADTIEALKRAKDGGATCISITNTPESTMENISHASIRTFAGSEIGVASTKTFSSQLAVFAKLALFFAHQKASIETSMFNKLSNSLNCLPAILESAFANLDLDRVVQLILKNDKCIVAGRGSFCAIAMEGALKIREVAYMSTIGIPAGEMKHGTMALVDETMPVIFILSVVDQLTFQKTISNIREVAARGGPIICITDDLSVDIVSPYAKFLVRMPATDEFCTPIVFSIPMQLLAYKLSIAKGLDADKPRNLAKSVTVE